MSNQNPLRPSATFPLEVLAEIHRAADQGIYEIRGFGTKRSLPNFDDLLFLGASMSRYPLEGYREKCATNVSLGTRFAKKPIELDIPITIAGMSFGALGANAKESIGRAASQMGTSTTTGDGGMTEEERQSSKTLVGQGAKPGGGGMLLGQKITERVAHMRDLPEGIDQRSACRHPDWTGPDDLEIKIQELREITDWNIPIYIKIGATRVDYDVALSVKAGADVIVLDGMQGGTAATQDVFIEQVGIPTLPALRMAVDTLKELGMHRKVQLIVSGGIRTGSDIAKALAMGADAVSIGSAAMVALGCNKAVHLADYQALGTEPGYCHHCHTGRCPVGVTTQDPELEARLPPEQGARLLRNYLTTLTLEIQTLARACGKSHVLNLEPEDMVALTIEAAAMAGIQLAGTKWIPGT
jgi:glutamate synthase domain-containing protein 2